MNAERKRTSASRSSSARTEQSGTAGTAATVEQSELGPLTPSHITAISARGLDVELLVKHGVGASSKLGGDAIGIPYFVGETRVGCKHRTLTGEKRFMQDVGSQQVLCNLNVVADSSLKAEPLVIVEGELDMFSAIQAGFPRSVSVPGGAPAHPTANDEGKRYHFLVEAEPLLAEVRDIILAVDGDGPGAILRHDLALRLVRTAVVGSNIRPGARISTTCCSTAASKRLGLYFVVLGRSRLTATTNWTSCPSLIRQCPTIPVW